MTVRTLNALAAALVASMFVIGAQNSHADNDKGKGHNKGHGAQHEGNDHDRHFEDRHRVVVREYYTETIRVGNCPPGLAKKNNGCMPPGQAKKWRMGYPLPREVVYYELPPQLVVQIGVPPPGYKYVRVAGDILMIAAGTSMVVDAIQDLGRL